MASIKHDQSLSESLFGDMSLWSYNQGVRLSLNNTHDKSMKKRILISFALAVLLLEVGFGVYVAFERKYESALSGLVLPIDSVKPIHVDTDRELEIASLLPVEDFVADTQVIAAAKKAGARSASSGNGVKKSATTSIAAAKPSRLRARTAPDKQTVALKTNELREIGAYDASSQKEISRTDNRSFIAKTQTIIKKPFGWMKAIASKMR